MYTHSTAINVTRSSYGCMKKFRCLLSWLTLVNPLLQNYQWHDEHWIGPSSWQWSLCQTFVSLQITRPAIRSFTYWTLYSILHCWNWCIHCVAWVLHNYVQQDHPYFWTIIHKRVCTPCCWCTGTSLNMFPMETHYTLHCWQSGSCQKLAVTYSFIIQVVPLISVECWGVPSIQ